ncbi:MAG TPA: alpha/beta hydrolase-fold protein [Vicinamibacterales bacterium]|nr:alpha/beta hydrolase-fold protein [Vicinamibacterales bacterium]
MIAASSHRAGILIVAAACMAACTSQPQTLKALLRQVDQITDPAAKTTVVERYLATRTSNPIVEQNARLIFFVRDDGSGRTPRIVGDFNAWAMTPQGYDAKAGTPTRIEGTPYSYLEGTAFTNARLEYTFLFDTEATTDPRNPRTVRTFTGPRSEIRMPFFTSHAEVDGPAPVQIGQVTQQMVASRVLKSERRVWTYVPAGYDGSEDIYPTVYFLDGGNYANWMAVPAVLDRLIAAKSIPPVIAVFVEPNSRQEEYSRNPAWRAFIATELVPFVDAKLRTFPAPDQRVIFGSSLGAYGALDLAVERPDIFGLCAAIAPPVQTATLITNQVQGQRAVFGVRFFVLGATYDTDVKGARTLRTALAEASADVTYEEVPEGHAAETFRAHIDDALKVLVPLAPAP